MKNSLAVLLLIFCVQGKAAPEQETLSIATASEFDTLHPLIASQGATKYMLYLAWRPLVILDQTSKWAAMSIKKLPSIENKLAKIKGEGMEVNVEINDNLDWGDNVPVTCKDLEFAWKVGKNPNISNPNREPFENITALTWDAKTPKKCTISLAKKKFDFFAQLPDPLPAHLEESIYEKYKDAAEGYDHNTLYVKEPSNPGLWFGPYRISEVKLGSHVIFVENSSWKGKKPAIKKIIFKLLPNNATHIANMKSGNVQMFAPPASIGLDQAISFEKEIKEQNLPYTSKYEDGMVYVHIDLNLDNPILKDLKVRKALSYSFDKNELIQSIMSGKAKPANQDVPERDPWYASDVAVYKYSLRDAAKLLDEAGWKMGPKGLRQKDGKDLSITLMGGAGNKIVEMTETYLQDQFKKSGIQLLVKNEPGRVFFGESLPHRSFDMAIYAWTSIPENSPRSTMHSGKISAKENSFAGQNYPGWKNAEVDKLVDQLEAEMNPKKRAELGKKIHRLYAAEVPVIPMYFRQANTVIPKGMKNYKLSGHIYYETLYAENWSY